MITIFILILISKVLSQPQSHAKVGNYPNLNMKACGIGLDNSYKSSNIANARIVDGDLAQLGEFPWMAFITTRCGDGPEADPRQRCFCGGVVIHSFWIITAYNCVKNKVINQIVVGLGSNERGVGKPFDVKDYIYHFSEDLALLEITPEIIPEKSSDKSYYKINGICLPEENITNNIREEAIFSGFGKMDQNAKVDTKFLRKANYMIEINCFDLNKICVNNVRQQACSGDSGSPLIQYDGNRAVVIGIAISGKTGNLCNSNSVIVFTRVSRFIEMIRNIVEHRISTNVTSTTGISPPIQTEPDVNSEREPPKESNADDNQESIAIVVTVVIFGIIIVLILILIGIFAYLNIKKKNNATTMKTTSGTLRSNANSDGVSGVSSVVTIHSQTGEKVNEKSPKD